MTPDDLLADAALVKRCLAEPEDNSYALVAIESGVLAAAKRLAAAWEGMVRERDQLKLDLDAVDRAHADEIASHQETILALDEAKGIRDKKKGTELRSQLAAREPTPDDEATWERLWKVMPETARYSIEMCRHPNLQETKAGLSRILSEVRADERRKTWLAAIRICDEVDAEDERDSGLAATRAALAAGNRMRDRATNLDGGKAE